MRIEKLKELVLFLIAIILIAVIIKYLKVMAFISKLIGILIPVFIGYIYAWLFNPLIKKMSHKYNRGLVSVVVFLLFIILVTLFLYFLIPIFYKEISEIIELLPMVFGKIEKVVETKGLKAFLDKLLVFLIDNLPMYCLEFISSLFKYVGVIGIGLILGLYMSIDYQNILDFWGKVIPKKYKCVVINLCKKVSLEVRKCVNGTLLVAFSVFLMDSVGFWLIGIDAPLLFGTLCGITDLIPYIGPYIGGVVAVLVAFTESRIKGILTIVLCFVVQAIENYILQPIVMSKSIQISPVLIIVGLLIFGNLFGVVGMILSTPCIAIIKVMAEHFKGILEECK